jgi:hypothetical protein
VESSSLLRGISLLMGFYSIHRLKNPVCDPKNRQAEKPTIAAQHSMLERFPVIAFSVDNIDAAVEKVSQHDISLPWGMEQDENSRWVMFHDPAGNLIELVQLNFSSDSTA